MSAHEILVAVKHADGVAGVVRDEEGWVSVSGDAERGGGTVLEGYQPAVVGLADDRTVQGGLLPPGAVAAEVVDDVGTRREAAAANGAWVIVLDQPTEGSPNPVRFSDAVGNTVAPLLPDDWPRSPVENAEEPCPACGARAWDEVLPLDGSRGMQDVDPDAPTAGQSGRRDHRTRSGGRRARSSSAGAAATRTRWARSFTSSPPRTRTPRRWLACAASTRRGFIARHERRSRASTSRSTRPKDGRRDSTGGVGACGVRPAAWRSDTEPHTASRGHSCGSTPSTTTIRSRASARSRAGALDHLLIEDDGDWPERSEAGLTVWLRARDRERRRRVALASFGRRQLLVDERPEEFELGAIDERWAAVRRIGDLVVTIKAKGVSPDEVELGQLGDPARALIDGDDSID